MPKKINVNYICPKCHKQFSQKSNYDYHVYKRKRPCVIKKSSTDNNLRNENKMRGANRLNNGVLYECFKCHKHYVSKYNLNRHLAKYCKGKFNPNNIAKNAQPIFDAGNNDHCNEIDVKEYSKQYNSNNPNDYCTKIAPNAPMRALNLNDDNSNDLSVSNDNNNNRYNNSDSSKSNEDFLSKTAPKCTKIMPNSVQIKKGNNPFTCDYCNRNYTRKSSLVRHLKDRCKIKQEMENEKEQIYKSLVDRMESLKDEVNKVKKENANLKTQLTINNNNITTNTNSNNITNNTQNFNIKIIAFGKEDLYDIFDEDTIKKYINHGFQSVKHLIHDTHFNKNKPELHNVYISNMKDVYAMTYNGTDWVLMKKDEVIDQLFDDKQCFLIDNYKELKNSLKESTRRKFERFLTETDDQVINGLKDDIKMLLYNKRKIPLGTKRN